MLIIPVTIVTSKCLSSESRGRERIQETVDESYIFGSIKHPAAPSFELRVPEKRKTVGRSSLYLHRRAIQRSTVQFVMICGERG